MLLTGGCEERGGAGSGFEGPIAPERDVALGPVSTFARDCASCHGERGALYARPFNYRGPALREKVEQMMRDHAHAAPSGSDIGAMLAYHMAIRHNEPFVIVTNAGAFVRGEAAMLRGQADPDAEVRIRARGQTLSPQRQGASWRLAEAPDPPLTVIARRQGKTRRLELPAE